MNSLDVTLLEYTPLPVIAQAIRTAWSSFDKSDTVDGIIGAKDKELIVRVGLKFKHASVLEHGFLILSIKNIPDNLKFILENDPYIIIEGDVIFINYRTLVEKAQELEKIIQALKGNEVINLLIKTEVIHES